MNCFQGRISQDYEHFLIAPYGMQHHEVTACSLVKVDMRGDVLDASASGIGLGVNKLGFSLHAAVYASRPDIKCIIHLRCPSAVAVSFLFIVTNTITLHAIQTVTVMHLSSVSPICTLYTPCLQWLIEPNLFTVS